MIFCVFYLLFWAGLLLISEIFVIMHLMKADIHPKYYPSAAVQCACGNKFTVGSTKEYIETEICSKCHPFYTKQEKVLDTLGRVQKFKEKMARKADKPKKAKKPKKERKK